MLSKNVNNKTCAPKLVFFNKKIEKYSDDFLHRKFTLKVRFWHFLTTRHYVNSQDEIISFEDIDFWPKTYFASLP